jgi:asparagine synthase (glutamine-hydrolysing)
MCGICGIVALDRGRPVPKEALERMAAAMAHRGPDGSATWFSGDGSVGLAHRRLSIIDLSDRAAQPMPNEDGTIQLTFNGEIYNFQSLRRELLGQQHSFRSQTDSEVIVHGYEEYGDAILDRLEGDFAFGLWDEPRRRLLLVRDRAGVKPVYHAQGDGFLIFASECKAIVASGLIPFVVDEEALYHYLSFLTTPAPLSMVEGVSKLAVGSSLTLDQDRGAWRVQRYWQPWDHPPPVDDGDLDEQLENLFVHSVRGRLVSDVPIGTLFSGGVDSTLNTVSFQRESDGAAVRTFSVSTVDDERLDETESARRMAKLLGTDHHEIRIGEQEIDEELASIVFAMDEPIADPVCVPQYFVTRLARDTGTVVLHAGEGADELFCGYAKYLRARRHHRWGWKTLAALPPFLSRAAYQATSRIPRLPLLNGKIADIFRRRSLGQRFVLSSAVGCYETEKARLLSSDFRDRTSGLDSFDVIEPVYQRFENAVKRRSFFQELLFLELNLRLPELLLMRTDRMSMAHSVEVRVPFLDHRLIEFALGVPDEFKLRDGITKEPIKRLLSQSVPGSDPYRPKRGFGAPVQAWLRSAIGRRARELITESASSAAEYFNVDLLARQFENPSSTNHAFQLWSVFIFLEWRRLMQGAAHHWRRDD